MKLGECHIESLVIGVLIFTNLLLGWMFIHQKYQHTAIDQAINQVVQVINAQAKEIEKLKEGK